MGRGRPSSGRSIASSRARGAALPTHKRIQVLLTRQLRIPALLNGEPPGMVEICAGNVEENNPEETVRKEAEQERDGADGAGLRWTAVWIDKGDGAKSALDRITIPRKCSIASGRPRCRDPRSSFRTSR